MTNVPQCFLDKIKGFNPMTQRYLLDINFRFQSAKNLDDSLRMDIEEINDSGEIVKIANVRLKNGAIFGRRYYYADGSFASVSADRAGIEGGLPEEPLATEDVDIRGKKIVMPQQRTASRPFVRPVRPSIPKRRRDLAYA